MSQQELLRRVVQVLKKAGIEYMLTGSLVSSLQGEPRSTHDIDLIIAIQQAMDALRVYEVQFEKLDTKYLIEWARELEVEPLLRRLQEEAEPI